jgi:hypothetical protein
MGDAAPLIATGAAELRGALPEGGVLLGLDLGTRTIGTALSDAGWRFATAGKTLPRGKFARDLEALRTLARGRARNRRGPMPATSPRWACRYCCGTSAGPPQAPNAT